MYLLRCNHLTGGSQMTPKLAPSKTTALYARVSTDGQSTENQLRELRQVSARMGWEIVAEFVDHGVIGAKGRDKRPRFDALCKGAIRRDFDVVMAWSVDRLSRSLQRLVTFLGGGSRKRGASLLTPARY
jgi:DNA invertase Pin-like site-specific DNA recombinase